MIDIASKSAGLVCLKIHLPTARKSTALLFVDCFVDVHSINRGRTDFRDDCGASASKGIRDGCEVFAAQTI